MHRSVKYALFFALVIVVVATQLDGVARVRFLLVVSTSIGVIFLVVVVALARRRIKSQGSSVIDDMRVPRADQARFPQRFIAIHSEITASLRDREFYERKLLVRILKTTGRDTDILTAVPDSDGGLGSDLPRAPVRRLFDRLVCAVFGRGVGIEEIEAELEKEID